MKKRFKKIYIEITNCCNLSCSFCPPTARKPHTMAPQDFQKILQGIRPWTDYIYLHVKGEPLLHPHLAQLLCMAAQNGFYVNLTSNGTLLPQRKEILLKYPPRQINISLHSFEANDRIPGGLTFEGYIRSAIDFAREFSPAHGITAFRLWNLPPEAMTESNREKNRLILKLLTESFGFTGSLDPRDYTVNDACLAPKTFLSFDQEFLWPDLLAPDFGCHGSCHGLKSHIAILCDGTVVPCCLDGNGLLALGNIFEQPLEDILAAPRSRRILEGFQAHTVTEELCRRCGYRTRFT